MPEYNPTPGEILNSLVQHPQPYNQPNAQYSPQQSAPQIDVPWDQLSPPVVEMLRYMQSRGISLYSPSSVLLFQVIINQNELIKETRKIQEIKVESLHGESDQTKKKATPKRRAKTAGTRRRRNSRPSMGRSEDPE